MSNDPQRPTISWKPQRPTISWNRTERPAPTPTPARQDTGSHPGRKVDREAYTYGIHVSTRSDLKEIKARESGQEQSMAGDAKPGSSYMWDAHSPTALEQPFTNPQYVGEPGFNWNATPAVYLTRAPSHTVFQDANVLDGPSLRVAGNQEIIESIPHDRAALSEVLKKHGIETRSFEDDETMIKERASHPQIKRDLAEKPLHYAENSIRLLIKQNRPRPPQATTSTWQDMMKLDHKAPLIELLKQPDARRIFLNQSNLEPKDLDKMIDRGHIGIQFDDY
jgi:hypothetical protein